MSHYKGQLAARRAATMNGKTAAEHEQERQENDQLSAELRAEGEQDGAPRWNGRAYAELSYPERAQLCREDPQLFAAMRGTAAPAPAAPLLWNGKTYAQLKPIERHQLAVADRALFAKMRKTHQSRRITT